MRSGSLYMPLARGVSESVKMGLSQLGVAPNLLINSNHGVLQSLFSAAHELNSRYF